jgi:hypothetical protein
MVSTEERLTAIERKIDRNYNRLWVILLAVSFLVGLCLSLTIGAL